MKRIAQLFFFLLPLAAQAIPIGPMNYQGRLLDNNGIPVTGSYNFVVKIYDDPTAGILKYQETINSVSVDDGVYAFKIGLGPKTGGDSLWDINLWQGNLNDLYLEIGVNGETLTPRHELTSAPHAFTATLALSADALGNKTAAEFDNILEGVCVSSKGKWLELANNGSGACLGAGSSFPGPTRVNWNTLTANNNFSNLDLSRADISGINFGSPSSANLTNTIFNETTYSVEGISGANLTSTLWDAAIATDAAAFSVVSTTKIAKAIMKNMDLSKWNMSLLTSSSNISMFSAAYLSNCPAAVIGYYIGTRIWECKLMHPTGFDYFMLGPYANFSTTSAAAIPSNGSMILDLDRDALDGAGTSFASFVGVTVTQDFTGGNIYYADFSYARLANITLAPASAVGAKFKYSEWENVIYPSTAGVFTGLDFSYSKLSHVQVYTTMNGNFANAVLHQVYFSDLPKADFTDASIEDVQIANLRYLPVTFEGTRISGIFNVTTINASDAPSMVFNNITFNNAIVSGALTDINFTGTLSFKNTVFKNLDLCSTTFPLVDTSAPHNDLSQIKWEGPVECPDGTDVAGSSTLYSGTCNYSTRMTATAIGNCTAGIPGTLQ